MSRYRVNAFLGLALGAALGVAPGGGPVAAADPIDDAWPYGGATALPYGGALPPTNYQNLDLGLFQSTQYDQTVLYTLSTPPFSSTPWYTEHFESVHIPLLATSQHEAVTSILDTAPGFPHVGTTLDSYGLILMNIPTAGEIPLWASYTLNDPELGFATTTGFPVLFNTYLSDDAGIKDFLMLFGTPITLFEIPFAAPSTDATVADLGGDFQQLLAAFSDAFPGVDTLLNLF